LIEKLNFGSASIPAFSSACIGVGSLDENSGRWLCQNQIF